MLYIILGVAFLLLLVLVLASGKTNTLKADAPKSNTTIINYMSMPLDIEMFDDQKICVGKSRIGAREMIKVPNKNVSIFRFMNGENIIGDYIANDECFIHVGQTIAKKQFMATSNVPIKDMPEIRIHNLTGVDLTFNGHIHVPARCMKIYTGKEQSGIAAGFTLQNNEELFEPFCLKNIVTDIYYGIMSSYKIPVFTARHMII